MSSWDIDKAKAWSQFKQAMSIPKKARKALNPKGAADAIERAVRTKFLLLKK